jgi:DNA-binding beta-propeller fold protein YncE
MKGCVLAVLAVAALAGYAEAQDNRASSASANSPLKLIGTIPLPTLHDGDFDHFAPDLAGHRLFLTAEENGQVLVFDTGTNELIHTIVDVKAPHSALYRQDLKKLFIVDGDDSSVKAYQGDTYKQVGRVDLAADADSMVYDDATKYMYVVNGGRGAKTAYSYITAVDTTKFEKAKEIKVDSDRVEAMALERNGPRLFCNITGKNAVGVFDRSTGALLATWMLPAGIRQNVSLALDETNHRLFVVTRQPGKLIVLNSDDGKVVTSVPAVGMVDDLAYDEKQKRLYLAGDQFVDIFEQKDADHYSLLGKTPGSFRAKTGILVPELHRYFLAVPHHQQKIAEVRVYEIQP